MVRSFRFFWCVCVNCGRWASGRVCGRSKFPRGVCIGSHPLHAHTEKHPKNKLQKLQNFLSGSDYLGNVAICCVIGKMSEDMSIQLTELQLFVSLSFLMTCAALSLCRWIGWPWGRYLTQMSCQATLPTRSPLNTPLLPSNRTEQT
jgi:hypothetical protein